MTTNLVEQINLAVENMYHPCSRKYFDTLTHIHQVVPTSTWSILTYILFLAKWFENILSRLLTKYGDIIAGGPGRLAKRSLSRWEVSYFPGYR